MSLTVRQRIFTLTDTYDVCDHTGRPRYSVWTEFLTIGHKIHVCDSESGEEVARIDEKVLTFLQKAVVTIHGVPWTVTRRLTFFLPKYRFDYNGWTVDGDFLGLSYRILDRNGNTVANIEHEPFHLSDHYVVTAADPRDELAAMLLAISIDMLNCGN